MLLGGVSAAGIIARLLTHSRRQGTCSQVLSYKEKCCWKNALLG